MADGTGGLQDSGITCNAVQPPSGRLTLLSGFPVQNADQSNKQTVFYDSYFSDKAPVYNGTHWTSLPIVGNEISVFLATANAVANSGFDFYLFNNSGTLTLCYSVAWTSTASRSNIPQSRQNGLLVNTNGSFTCYYGPSGTTVATLSALTGTYVGSALTISAGQVSMALNPPSASGGTEALVNLYNFYNQVPVTVRAIDTKASWTNTAGTWGGADGATAGLVILGFDGQQNISVDGTYTVNAKTSLASVTASTGIFFSNGSGLGSSPNAGATVSNQADATAGSTPMSTKMTGTYPRLGRFGVVPGEISSGSTTTFLGPAQTTARLVQ